MESQEHLDQWPIRMKVLDQNAIKKEEHGGQHRRLNGLSQAGQYLQTVFSIVRQNSQARGKKFQRLSKNYPAISTGGVALFSNIDGAEYSYETRNPKIN